MAERHGRRRNQRRRERDTEKAEHRAKHELAQNDDDRRQRYRLRLNQRREQIALDELHDHVEPDRIEREREALAAGDEDDRHGADDRSEIRQEPGKRREDRKHERQRHAEDEEADIGDGPDRDHGQSLADQPAPQDLADLEQHFIGGVAAFLRRKPREAG